MRYNWKQVLLLLLVALVLISCTGVYASPMEKRILGLYKSSDNADDSNNAINNYLKKPLEDLGYTVECRDALKPLPSAEEMKRYSAVVTFYYNPVMPEVRQYLTWLRDQVESGRKVIILGNFGAHSGDGQTWLTNEDLNDFFYTFGISFKGASQVNPDTVRVTFADTEVVTRVAEQTPESYTTFHSLDDQNKAYLTLTLEGQPDSTSSPIIRTPAGGFALINYLYTAEPGGQLQWNINLTAFLRDVLSYQSPPRTASAYLLGLYKKSDKYTAENNFIRRFAEEPLYKLGYRVDYWDIEQGIPDNRTMRKYSGVISWYESGEMKNAARYCEWLGDQVAAEKKVIILGDFGAYTDIIESGTRKLRRYMSNDEVNNFFWPFGLRMDWEWISDAKKVRVDHVDTAMVNLSNVTAPEDVKDYIRFKSVSPGNKNYLVLSRTDIPESESSVIVTTPYGGMVMGRYVFKQDPKTWRISSTVNLDKFFSDCLKRVDFVPPRTYSVEVDAERELATAAGNGENLKPLPCPDPIRRKVLVLFKGSESKSFVESMFYINGGPVLNHLGLTADYLDIEAIHPDDIKMEGYLGIITWFQKPLMKNAEEYNQWLLWQLDNGRKVVILGNYGAFNELGSLEPAPGARLVFKKLGLQLVSEQAGIKASLKSVQTDLLTARYDPVDFEAGRPDAREAFSVENKVARIEKGYFGYESSMNLANDHNLLAVRSIDDSNRVLLVLNSNKGQIEPAVIGSSGSVLLGDFFCRFKQQEALKNAKDYKTLINTKNKSDDLEERDQGQWVVNPFKFFTEAFELENHPMPDYTTLNGKRIFYSHIDGDGLITESDINPFEYSSEIIMKDVLEKYNVPITVSVITNEITRLGKKYYNRPLIVAREIMALDNVEIASHTHSHPYDYHDGDLEFKILKEGGNYRINYVKPRPEDEILHSTALINQNIAPPGKRMKMVLWSGECNPTEEFISFTDRLDLENMNGGDPLYDKKHRSVSYICPAYTKLGDRIQVHTSGSNDYIYTAAWTSKFDGMKDLIAHMDATETPVRLCPINIYYHFYSGQYDKSLKALQDCYEYAMKQEIAPLFASQYSKIINDFHDIELGYTGDGGYIIRNMGYLRTIRFDNSKLAPDMERSSNVIGYDYVNDSLYVFLDEMNDHVIYLVAQPATATYLKSASHYINRWKATPTRVTAMVEGLGAGTMRIANLKPDTMYRITCGMTETTVQSNDDGMLEFAYNLGQKPGTFSMEVEISK